MIRNIMPALAIAAIIFLSLDASAQSAQTNGNPEPRIRVASNVSVGTESVHAWYPNAEFILKYCGEATLEIDGKTFTFDARVAPTEPGVWLAEKTGSVDYIKLFVTSGNTNAYINGEHRVFLKPKM